MMASRMLAQVKHGRGWRLARGRASVLWFILDWQISGALLGGVRPIAFPVRMCPTGWFKGELCGQSQLVGISS